MNNRVLAFAAVFSFVLAGASRADMFSVQVVSSGVAGGVSFSWLTTGTNASGGSADGAWRVEGNILVDYDANGGTLGLGSVTLLGSDQDLSIKSGSATVGTLTVNSFFLADPNLGGDGDLLGHMDITVSSNGSDSALDSVVAASATGRVEYIDKSYGQSSNGFNGFAVNDDELQIRLWGNELVWNDPAFPTTAANWGNAWASNGQLVIPAPDASMLAMLAMPFVAWFKGRFTIPSVVRERR